MFKNFRLHIVSRILLILALGFAMLYILTQTHFWLVAFWLGLAVIILTSELIYFIERSHKDLENFLLSIRQSDFSTLFPGLRNKGSNDELKQAYTEILKVFQHLRSEKESGHQYLQTVVEHIKVALVCYDDKEEIHLMNGAARQLFGKPYIKNIKALEQIDKPLLETIRHLEAGKKELVKVMRQGHALHLSVQATAFKLGHKSYKLVSFQDIGSELEAQEVESWQKLIRVLTHEIMNSVIPIATLSSVVNEMLQEKAAQHPHPEEEEKQEIRNSLQTIENRSKGLVSFVRAYASLTQTAKPVMQDVAVEVLFNRVYTLLRPAIDKKHIKFTIRLLQEDLQLKADPELLEQVLINLLLNAIDALEHTADPAIELTAGRTGSGQTALQVKDNGTGIDEQTIQHIFVPFFTTKKKGSGIGLSLSKQLMLLHKGNITVQSVKGEGTVFKLTFPS
jgi:two-component system, NtrC family, nitrogen regulation sensor histidine kinase NtrY